MLLLKVELLEQQLELSTDKDILQTMLDGLNAELADKVQMTSALEQITQEFNISSEELSILKNQLHSFLIQIHSQAPDVQNLLLKQYVQEITINLINNTICIHLVIKANNDGSMLFDKYLYTSF